MVNKVEIKLSCVIGNLDINQSNRHYNAYWRGSQQREFRKEILQAMQVGEGQQI